MHAERCCLVCCAVVALQPFTQDADLFGALDQYLRSHKLRLRQAFDEVDADGDGDLDTTELADLVVRLLPDTTDAELRYFQVSERLMQHCGWGETTTCWIMCGALSAVPDYVCTRLPCC